METLPEQRKVGQVGGPKYEVNIEGTNHPWDRDQITVPELRALGNIPSDTPVEMIDLQSNEQRTLAETEIVNLKPGLGFSKKTQFRRG
jgi:hypothetical protein